MDHTDAVDIGRKYQFLVGTELKNMDMQGYTITKIEARSYGSGKYDVNWVANNPGAEYPYEERGSLQEYCEANGIEFSAE